MSTVPRPHWSDGLGPNPTSVRCRHPQATKQWSPSPATPQVHRGVRLTWHGLRLGTASGGSVPARPRPAQSRGPLESRRRATWSHVPGLLVEAGPSPHPACPQRLSAGTCAPRTSQGGARPGVAPRTPSPVARLLFTAAWCSTLVWTRALAPATEGTWGACPRLLGTVLPDVHVQVLGRSCLSPGPRTQE